LHFQLHLNWIAYTPCLAASRLFLSLLVGSILSPVALFEACARFPLLQRLMFALKLEMSQMFRAACAYVCSLEGA